ncbi:hypothetical protein [Vibrio chagasii]|nr:hypothetical protein [Vibrio chagasii]
MATFPGYSAALWNGAYGSYWPYLDSVGFIATYNIVNPARPYIVKTEIYSNHGRKTVNLKSDAFVFSPPILDTATPSCSVTLINPARLYSECGWSGRWMKLIGAGYNSVNKNNVSRYTTSGVVGNLPVHPTCHGGPTYFH